MKNGFDPKTKGKENKQTNRKKWYKAVCSLAAAVVVCTVYTLMLPALTLDEQSAGDAGISISESSVPTTEAPAASENTSADTGSDSGSTDAASDNSSNEAENGTAADAPSDDSAADTPSASEPSTDDVTDNTATGSDDSNKEAADSPEAPNGNVNNENNDNNEEIKNEENSGSPAADSDSSADTDENADAENDADKSDDTADVETEADWIASVHNAISAENWNEMSWAEKLIAVAQTQLGYGESVLNFRVDNDGNHKGYTRYGEWYGNPYGDWCAMFVSFCLNYAGIDEEAIPQNANCADWVRQFKNMDLYEDTDLYVPEAGDIVFFDQTGNGTPNHVGIIEEVTYGTKTVTRHITKDGAAIESSTSALLNYLDELKSGETADDTLQTEEIEVPVAESVKVIEGNSSDRVQYVTYGASDDNILGYVSITKAKNVFEGVDPENKAEEQPAAETPIVKEYEVAGDYKITATYTSEAKLPESAILKARELTGDEYNEHYQMALAELGVDELSFARFFDITFESADGFKLEPAADSSVNVQITYYDDNNKPEIKEDETANAVHFGDNGTEVLPVETTGAPESVESMSFTQSSFSVTGTVVSVTSPVSGKYVLLSANAGAASAIYSSKNYADAVVKDDNSVIIMAPKYNDIGIEIVNNSFAYNGKTYTLKKAGTGYNASYSSGNTTYYLSYNNGGWTSLKTTAYIIYLSNNYTVTEDMYTVTFDVAGGNEAAPAPEVGTKDTVFTFPEYTGTNGQKVFVGWAKSKNADPTDVDVNLPVYSPGTQLTINESVTYYAIYAELNGGACFYLALDGNPRDEPRAKKNDSAEFTWGIHVNNALKVNKFYANSAGVDANLNNTPTVERLEYAINHSVDTLKKSSVMAETIKNGVYVEDGKLYSKTLNKDGGHDELYVIWYVTKYRDPGPSFDATNTNGTANPGGSHCKWHVDGYISTKAKVTLYYNRGEGVREAEVTNWPVGHQYDPGTDIVAGSSDGDNRDVRVPARAGYTFTGWKAYKYVDDEDDHIGDYMGYYESGKHFTINEDTILVAQWQLNQTGVVLKKINKDRDSLSGAVFVLKKWNGSEYAFYKTSESDSTYTVNSANGISLGKLEDGKYQLQEMTAPDGYNLLTDTVEFTVNNGKVTIAEDDASVALLDKVGDGYTISIINESGVELPETGGSGTTLLYLLGVLLTTAALTIIFIRRRESASEEN